MRKFVTRKFAVAFGLALMLSGLVAGLAWSEARRQERAAARAAHSREVLAALDGLTDSLADAEAGRCSFLVRAEPRHRERFLAAADRARAGVRRLRDLTAADDPGALEATGALVGRQLALLEESVRLRQRQRFHTRGQLALTQKTRAVADDLRGTLAALRSRADRALARQAREVGASARQAGAAVGLGNLLALLAFGATAVALGRDLAARERSAATVKEAHQQAEARASQAEAAVRELAALRGRLEEQFRQAQRLAALGRVTGEVAHDFNNLLTVILSCSQATLAGLAEDDPARPVLAEVVQAGRQAAKLTRQVLAVGRSRPTAPAPLALNELVEGLEALLRRMAGRGVEVELALEPGLAPVWADRGQVEQALLNLAANARDAMPDGGKLCIQTGGAGPLALLAVTDTGCGMDGETRSRLFEPFFTTKAEGKGTGLGMAIVHEAASRCGGRVEVDSEPGRGTSVRVFLPFAGAGGAGTGVGGAAR